MSMKTLTAPTDIRTIARAAQREPVRVVAEGEAAFVAVSPGEFDRLEEQDRVRREARDELKHIVARMRTHAAEQGLTETELDRLLADES
jgi:PHD/YefM family antitoxin component YafN of YafNO toxin-antitoxin module